MQGTPEVLERAIATLRQHWSDTESAWRDHISRRFRDNHVTQIEDDAISFLLELRTLEDAVNVKGPHIVDRVWI